MSRVRMAKLEYHLDRMEHLPCSSDRAVDVAYRLEGLINQSEICWKNTQRLAHTRTINAELLNLVVEISPSSRKLF